MVAFDPVNDYIAEITPTDLPPISSRGHLHFATSARLFYLSDNMGADGGSIPDRRDLVKTKGRAEITDKALLRELYFFCALSKVSTSRVSMSLRI